MMDRQWTVRIVLYFIISVCLVFLSEEPFTWIHVLLYSAVIIWVPIGVDWCIQRAYIGAMMGKVLLPAGVLYGIAMILPNGIISAFMSLPWLVLALVSTFMVVNKSENQQTQQEQGMTRWLIIAAFLFWIVGAIWGLAYQLDYRLMGFPKVIVALTAAHFHFAGFLLSLLTAYLMSLKVQLKWIRTQIIGVLIFIGIPLTALGILFTHLTGINYLETVAGVIMAIAGLSVAFAFLQIKHRPLLKLGASILALGMILAFLFAIRNIYPINWLDIPRMYTWHGSMNTIAIGLLVVGSFRKATA